MNEANFDPNQMGGETNTGNEETNDGPVDADFEVVDD